MKEQLEPAIAAATELLAIPECGRVDAESSAEWLRRAMRRERAIAVAEEALRKAHGVVSAAKNSCGPEIEQARAAVLEDAARGDIR